MTPQELAKGCIVFLTVVFICVAVYLVIADMKDSLPVDSAAQRPLTGLQKLMGVLVDLSAPDPLELLGWAVGLVVAACLGIAGGTMWYRNLER